MELSRRSLLGVGAAGLATAILGLPKPAVGGRRTRAPKNIIYLVADGMAISVPTMADIYQQRVLGTRSYWMDLIEQPDIVTGLQDTHSLSSVVTDSAAAASAWGSGVYHWNGTLNMLPDNRPLEPLGRLFKKAGMKVGLVTTTTITHATPSGFAISQLSRDDEAAIAAQHLEHGIDVLMGGGNKFFAADKRKDKRDLYAEFAAKGYAVARQRGDVIGKRASKILGVFSDSHLPFSVDRNHDRAMQREVPTLAEMAKCAIENLKDSPNGFLLQIEGGKVDHGGHANDIAASVFDFIAFEEAVRVAMDFARENGETLVVITSDHATGGPALNGAGDEYYDATAGLLSLQGMKCSYAPLLAKIGPQPTVAGVRDAVEEMLGLGLSVDEGQGIVDSLSGRSPFKLSSLHASAGMSMAMILGNHTEVKWTSGNHTNDHVILSAYGPGSERFHGLTRNVEVFKILTEFKGISHQNPSMSFEDAKKIMMPKALAGVDHTCCCDDDPFEAYAL